MQIFTDLTIAPNVPDQPTGWEAPAGSSVSFFVPDNWAAGRIWVSTAHNSLYASITYLTDHTHRLEGTVTFRPILLARTLVSLVVATGVFFVILTLVPEYRPLRSRNLHSQRAAIR